MGYCNYDFRLNIAFHWFFNFLKLQTFATALYKNQCTRTINDHQVFIMHLHYQFLILSNA